MAHYALLDKNNKVVNVITGVDETEFIEGQTPEEWYGRFHNMKCLRTSYNTLGNQHKSNGVPFRGNYAGIDYTYDEELDVFLSPKPFNSWKLNHTTFLWEAPIAKPAYEEGFVWKWAEPNKEWIKIAIPTA